MRIQLTEAVSLESAVENCPWASDIVQVEGGYLCFEDHTRCLIWKNQK